MLERAVILLRDFGIPLRVIAEVAFTGVPGSPALSAELDEAIRHAKEKGRQLPSLIDLFPDQLARHYWVDFLLAIEDEFPTVLHVADLLAASATSRGVHDLLMQQYWEAWLSAHEDAILIRLRNRLLHRERFRQALLAAREGIEPTLVPALLIHLRNQPLPIRFALELADQKVPSEERERRMERLRMGAEFLRDGNIPRALGTLKALVSETGGCYVPRYYLATAHLAALPSDQAISDDALPVVPAVRTPGQRAHTRTRRLPRPVTEAWKERKRGVTDILDPDSSINEPTAPGNGPTENAATSGQTPVPSGAPTITVPPELPHLPESDTWANESYPTPTELPAITLEHLEERMRQGQFPGASPAAGAGVEGAMVPPPGSTTSKSTDTEAEFLDLDDILADTAIMEAISGNELGADTTSTPARETAAKQVPTSVPSTERVSGRFTGIGARLSRRPELQPERPPAQTAHVGSSAEWSMDSVREAAKRSALADAKPSDPVVEPLASPQPPSGPDLGVDLVLGKDTGLVSNQRLNQTTEHDLPAREALTERESPDLPGLMVGSDGWVRPSQVATQGLPPAQARRFNEGLTALQNGELAQAREALDAVVAVNPEHPQALLHLGLTAARQGDAPSARRSFDHALELEPDLWEAWFNRGHLYDDAHKHRQAESDFTRAIELNPDFVDAYICRGLSRVAIGEYRRAMIDFDKAAQRRQNDPGICLNRGICYRRMGELQKALREFREAIHLDERYEQAYMNAGLVSEEAEDFGGAVEFYRRLLDKAPEHAEAHYRLGLLSVRMGDHMHAVEAFDEALRLEPERLDAMEQRGISHVILGHYEEGIADLSLITRMEPSNVPARFHEGLAHYHAGRLDEATEAFLRVVRIDRAHERALYFLGLTMNQRQRFGEAVRVLSRLVRLQPTHVEALLARAQAHYRMGDEAAGLQDVTTAVSLNPRDPAAFLLRARWLIASKRPQDAIKDLERALHQDPYNEEVIILMRDVFLALGDKEKAREYNQRLEKLLDDTEEWDQFE